MKDDSKEEEDSDEAEEDNEKEVDSEEEGSDEEDSDEEENSKEEEDNEEEVDSEEEENSDEEDSGEEENSEEEGEDDNKKEKEDNEVQKDEKKEDAKNVKKITHWPVLLFIAGLTQLTHITRLITQWAGVLISDDHDELILAHPALCQLLFECQSPQLVSTVFKGRRVKPYNSKMTSPLDWFVLGYCIAHCDTTSSWSDVVVENSSQCLQAFSSGLHYSSTSGTHCRIGKTGSLTEMEILVHDEPISPFLEAFRSLYPYTQAITYLTLRGDLHSDHDRGFPVLQQLFHYCPKLQYLQLPRLHPPYTSLPYLPHTLGILIISLPLMTDDSILGDHLQQYQSLKCLILLGSMSM